MKTLRLFALICIILSLAANNANAQFRDDFNSSTLDPAWTIVQTWPGGTYRPGNWGTYLSGNHYSLTDNPGYLRYWLDPMTHPEGYQNNYATYLSYYYYDAGLELHRTFTGDKWVIEAGGIFNLPQTNGRGFVFRIYFGDGEAGTYFVSIYRGADVHWNGVFMNLTYKTGPEYNETDVLTTYQPVGPWYYGVYNYPPPTPQYYRVERNGGQLTVYWSDDAIVWSTAFNYNLGTALDGLEQRIVIGGICWFNPAGSYADWDYVSLKPLIEPLSIVTQAQPATFSCSSQSGTDNWLTNAGGAVTAGGCGTVTWTYEPYTLSGGCSSNTGSATVYFTGTDECNNTVTTNALLTVTDNEGPSWTTLPGDLDRTLFCGNSQALEAAQALVSTASDACCTDIAYEKTSGEFEPGQDDGSGTYTNTWIAKDQCGNQSTLYTQVITITKVNIDASSNVTPQSLKSTSTIVPVRITSFATAEPVPNIDVTLYIDDINKGTNKTGSEGYALFDIGVLETGVYKIYAVAGEGCNETTVYLPVYDPNGGFVTGGGWINSPEGAYKPDLSLSGKANFGFVAKYKKGSTVPGGNTEFQFKAADLNFRSSSYEDMRLVIAGAKANFKGQGIINGTGNYGFMVSAIDGQITRGGGIDKFRIKIWDLNHEGTIVYDNNITDTDENAQPATAIEGGSIVIHSEQSKSEELESDISPKVESPILRLYPNPFSESLQFEFASPVNGNARIEIYDVSGRHVKTIFNNQVEGGVYYKADFKPNTEINGIYFYRMKLGEAAYFGKAVYKK